MFQHYEQTGQWSGVKPVLPSHFQLSSQLFWWVPMIDMKIVRESFASWIPHHLVDSFFRNDRIEIHLSMGVHDIFQSYGGLLLSKNKRSIKAIHMCELWRWNVGRWWAVNDLPFDVFW